ncbi:very-long-chain 3-oxoacyl-CoA reductase 1-like protein [Cinnamomum micranthum f. kanehirae]|uniref:Very-long-chain 3-oxoacyl-CoA reductase 1-like protein n=1 Tax=Cinnamomum micranthum f. kanehirae TaxID=337451 RepID=A0A443Q1T5_9MAGN|nr:very-long-chain 3-oxoacyl-CoA reductase 1-like protein [Cinnamomum micranthum f. kanehirae]
MVVRSLDIKKDLYCAIEENKKVLGPEVPYLSAIGASMYLAQCARPDIAFSVNLLARYIHYFSRSLYVEYKHYGIDVQCQIPLFMATKMLPSPLSSFLAPTPEEYSRACLRWIGYEPLCMPYWRHSLQGTLAQAIPAGFTDWVALKCFLHLRKTRKSRAMRDVMKRNS